MANIPTVTFNNGHKMQAIGLGTYGVGLLRKYGHFYFFIQISTFDHRFISVVHFIKL